MSVVTQKLRCQQNQVFYGFINYGLYSHFAKTFSITNVIIIVLQLWSHSHNVLLIVILRNFDLLDVVTLFAKLITMIVQSNLELG
jgi:hypothetical protein